MAQPVRIVLIEDHAILREGLRALIELEPDLRVVGEATCTADGLAAVKAVEPALVITDLALPGTSGLRGIEELPDGRERRQSGGETGEICHSRP